MNVKVRHGFHLTKVRYLSLTGEGQTASVNRASRILLRWTLLYINNNSHSGSFGSREVLGNPRKTRRKVALAFDDANNPLEVDRYSILSGLQIFELHESKMRRHLSFACRYFPESYAIVQAAVTTTQEF